MTAREADEHVLIVLRGREGGSPFVTTVRLPWLPDVVAAFARAGWSAEPMDPARRPGALAVRKAPADAPPDPEDATPLGEVERRAIVVALLGLVRYHTASRAAALLGASPEEIQALRRHPRSVGDDAIRRMARACRLTAPDPPRP